MEIKNATTGNFYSDSNTEVLTAIALGSGFESGLVAGYNQWKSVGRQVKKGSVGIGLTRIVVVKDKKTGKDVTKPTTVVVFFKEQTQESVQ